MGWETEGYDGGSWDSDFQEEDSGYGGYGEDFGGDEFGGGDFQAEDKAFNYPAPEGYPTGTQFSNATVNFASPPTTTDKYIRELIYGIASKTPGAGVWLDKVLGGKGNFINQETQWVYDPKTNSLVPPSAGMPTAGGEGFGGGDEKTTLQKIMEIAIPGLIAGSGMGLFGDNAQEFMMGKDPFWDTYTPDPATFGVAQQGYRDQLAALLDPNHPLNQESARYARSLMSPVHAGQNERLAATAADMRQRRALGAYKEGYELTQPIVRREGEDPGFLQQVSPYIGGYYGGSTSGQKGTNVNTNDPLKDIGNQFLDKGLDWAFGKIFG